MLVAQWEDLTLSHEECMQAWNLQVIEDKAIMQEEWRLTQEQEDQQQAQRELELKNKHRELRKREEAKDEWFQWKCHG